MRKLLLALLLASAGRAAHGQEYYLDLHKQHLEVANRSVAVESVVDGRRSPQIGVKNRVAQGHPATIFFRVGAAPELTDLLHAQLPARPTDHPIVLCLRQLKVTDIASYGVLASGLGSEETVKLGFDAYVHLPDGYHFVQRVAGHWVSYSYRGSPDAPARLARLLSYCLAQLGSADWAAPAQRPALALAQLPADAPELASVPPPTAAILREAPRRGLYRSFDQFLANRPDTSLAFRLDTLKVLWPGRYRTRALAQAWWGWWHVAQVRPLAATGRRRPAVPEGLWGFSDGQRLFIQYKNKFCQLVPRDGLFAFVAEAPFNFTYQVITANTPAQRLSLNPLLPSPILGGEPVALALDLPTGEVGSFPGLRARHPDTAYVYLYRPAQARDGQPVQVLANGRFLTRLFPGTYYQLRIPNHTQPLRLSLLDAGVPDGPGQLLLPDPAHPLFLEITPVEGDNRYWRWVPAAQAQAAIGALAQAARP